jgi:hypothetical protein
MQGTITILPKAVFQIQQQIVFAAEFIKMMPLQLGIVNNQIKQIKCKNR